MYKLGIQLQQSSISVSILNSTTLQEATEKLNSLSHQVYLSFLLILLLASLTSRATILHQYQCEL